MLMMHVLVIVLHLLVSEGNSNVFSYYIFLIAIPKDQIYTRGLLLVLRQVGTLLELNH